MQVGTLYVITVGGGFSVLPSVCIGCPTNKTSTCERKLNYEKKKKAYTNENPYQAIYTQVNVRKSLVTSR